MGGIMDFVPRYREYELDKERTNQLIKDLMIYAETLESQGADRGLHQENALLRQELREKELDLEDATQTRRNLQQRLMALESRPVGFSSPSNDSAKKQQKPYVVVVIDGNGLLFHEKFYKQGLDGGKKAAYALQKTITQQCGTESEVEVVIKIVANLVDLGKAMKRDGSIENEKDMRDFMVGFSQTKPYFDFVDIGSTKGRAEAKIKDTATWHLRNPGCQQVLLGISHEAAYASFLEDVFTDYQSKRRVVILEGTQTADAIQATGANIIAFDDIFRDGKLDSKSPSSGSAPSISSFPSPTTKPASISYATVTQKASPPPQITLPIPLKSISNNGALRRGSHQVPWRPGPRGLDPPIPINQAVLEAIKKRKDNNKLCNNHYLRGPCTKGADCCFEHSYAPNKDEINAIALLARLNPCTNGQDCDVDNCIYGHHCPSVSNGSCSHPYCKFRVEEHPPGTKLKSKTVDFL